MYIIVIPVIISVVWYLIWTKTYDPYELRGLIRHEVIFTAASAGIFYLAARVIFSPVDESYSYSNKGALGFVVIIFGVFLGCSCLAALGTTIGMFITRNDEKETDDKKEQ